MANEITKVTDQNGVDHPFKDVAAFPRSEQAVLGAKNLLPNNASTTTTNGITFTVNEDKSVTVNGTATADATLTLANGFDIGNTTIYSYNSENVDVNGYRLTSGLENGGDNDFYMAYAQSLKSVMITVRTGKTVNNKTVYPMVRLATDPDSTYVPHTMTNKELTEKAFKYVDYLASKDLNTITETGFYKLGGSITNGPGVNYGFLEVFKTDANNITQIVHGLSTGEFIYSRRYYNSTWGSWYKFTGTAVS